MYKYVSANPLIEKRPSRLPETPRVGGYFGFQVTGMIKWRQNSKPQKLPSASNNPWTKQTAAKTSLVVLYSQNYTAWIRGHYRESSDCFEYPQKSLLKSSHPKHWILAKFSYPKKIQEWKILRSSRNLKSGVPSLGLRHSTLIELNRITQTCCTAGHSYLIDIAICCPATAPIHSRLSEIKSAAWMLYCNVCIDFFSKSVNTHSRPLRYIPFESYLSACFKNYISIYEGSFVFERNWFKTKEWKTWKPFKSSNVFGIPVNYTSFCSC